jgi:hypothetical protein
MYENEITGKYYFLFLCLSVFSRFSTINGCYYYSHGFSENKMHCSKVRTQGEGSPGWQTSGVEMQEHT